MSEVTYKLLIKTSNAFTGSGTNATLSFSLYSQDATEFTDYFVLDHFFRDDFEPGREDNFEVKKKNVGVPGYIRIRRTGILADEWFCDYIRVSLKDDESKSATFPIYDWVSTEMGVAEGTATLPQKVQSKHIRLMRAAEVSRNQEAYKWIPPPVEGDVGWGMPRFVNATTEDELPITFLRTTTRQSGFDSDRFYAKLTYAGTLVTTTFKPINELKDYHSINWHSLTKYNIPNYVENWETDEVMGRQVLTGVNAAYFQRCTSIPDGFNVTNRDVSSFLSAGKTLESEIEAGKIYISNYKEVLEGAGEALHYLTKQQLYAPLACGLFYVNFEGKFLPIAIQLVPGDRDYLFTPADSKDDWMLAKMYFRCADASHHEISINNFRSRILAYNLINQTDGDDNNLEDVNHTSRSPISGYRNYKRLIKGGLALLILNQWVSHFLLTHNVMEPFAVSLFRSFPICHPLYKLLKPHLRTIPIINTGARSNLLPLDKLASQIIGRKSLDAIRLAYKTFTFEYLVIPKRLKKQGTDDPNLLPNYFYRDDALMLWKIIENYFGKVIRHYYKNDDDVREDFELQFWAKDCAVEGLAWNDGNTRGMPESITSIESLIEICVTLMFTSSVQHAAVNFGQLDNYQFAPNAPSAMRLPPHRKGEANMKRILDSLPDAFLAASTITITKILSSLSSDELFLGNYAQGLFTEQAVLKMQQDYRDELIEAEDIINKRNATLKVPYTWLMPSRVPNSIAI